ncbi:MAG: NUDIX hydrolase [Nanoarchaeota archaeon]|nr:NUDIX hydrolase [Nanoarchaeota archaeon]
MKHYIFALIKDKEKVLMLKRPKDKKSHPSYWNLPGGKINQGETESQCVIREVEEETGLKFKPISKILDIIDENIEPKKVTVFSGSAEGLVKINEEHEEYGWFTIAEIHSLPVMAYIRKIIV